MENKDVRYWYDEMERCKDFVYFYNKYIRKEGQPEVTREEYISWQQMANQLRHNRRPIHYAHGLSLNPLTPKDCIEP